MTGSPNALWGS